MSAPLTPAERALATVLVAVSEWEPALATEQVETADALNEVRGALAGHGLMHGGKLTDKGTSLVASYWAEQVMARE